MSSRPPPGLPLVDAMTPPVLVLSGPLTSGEVSGPCEALRALLDGEGRGRVVVCDVAGLGPPGLAAVNLLARLQLTARRAAGGYGCGTPHPRSAPCSTSSVSASRRRGSPNSGNHRCVSRKQWNPVIRPSEISSAWIAHGVYPPFSGSGL